MNNDKFKKLGLRNPCASSCYESEKKLKTKIIAQSSYGTNENVMTLEVKNNFEHTIWLYTLPIKPTENKEIINPGIFIAKKNGEELEYKGRLSSLDGSFNAEYYQRLEPGQVYSFQFRPELSFEMQSAGSYSVQFAGNLEYLSYDPIAKINNEEESQGAQVLLPAPPSQAQIESGQAVPQLNNAQQNPSTFDTNTLQTTVNEVVSPDIQEVFFTTSQKDGSTLAYENFIIQGIESQYNSKNAFTTINYGTGWTNRLRDEILNARDWNLIWASAASNKSSPGPYFTRWFGNGGTRMVCENVLKKRGCVGIGNKKFRCPLTGKEGWKNNKGACDAACQKWEQECKNVNIQPDRANNVKGKCDSVKSICNSRNITWVRARCGSGELGYMYPDQPNHIYICNACPFANSENQVNLLLAEVTIHEMFHHAGVCCDWAYNRQPCLSLAKNDPKQAIQNADNYTYFSMDA